MAFSFVLKSSPKWVLMCGVICSLTSCAAVESQNDGKPFALTTYEHINARPLNVLSYEVIDESGQLNSPDHVYRGFVENPTRAIFNYLQNRYSAVGHSGKLKVSLESLSVDENSITPDTFLGEWFGVGVQDVYSLQAEFNVELWGNADDANKGVHFRVTRDVRIPDYWSLADRQVKQKEAIEHMIYDIDVTLQDLLTKEFVIQN